MTTKYQIGVILDSAQAFDIYHDATGGYPPPMDEGCNTRRIPFTLRGPRCSSIRLVSGKLQWRKWRAKR